MRSTRRVPCTLSVCAVSLLAVTCSETQRPAAPSSSPPTVTQPAPPAMFDVTGVVYESTATGRRPLADVGIDISVEYQSWPARTTTGADGRYRWPGFAGGKIIAEKPGYRQPCRVPVAPTDHDQDVYLVSSEILSTTGVPSSFPIIEPTLRGLVYERTPQGMQPIDGAQVVLDFTGGMGWAPSATTTTDAAGRYLLCNVVDSTGFGWYAYVSKPGYSTAYVPVNFQRADVELQRQR